MREGGKQNSLSPVTGGEGWGEGVHFSPFTLHLIAAALLAGAMSGCGTVAKRDSGASKAPSTLRGGGYYLDDGPDANPPADLDGVPDAVPRRERLHRGAGRPYAVMGRDYTPMTALAPYRARGMATWYGRRYHGKPTSSGEIYDMYAMTGAHPTLPIPSYARVTNIGNGKSVVVRINDRGPFVDGRVIDVSYTAAHKLGMLGRGSAMVEVEALIPGTMPDPPPEALGAPRPEPTREAPLAATLPASEPAAVSPSSVPEVPVSSDGSGVYLQLGAFGSQENAENFRARLALQVDWLAGRLHIATRDGLSRVRAGPYGNEIEARQVAERIVETLGIKPIVLTQ
jgi:rare lipoprotein A